MDKHEEALRISKIKSRKERIDEVQKLYYRDKIIGSEEYKALLYILS